MHQRGKNSSSASGIKLNSVLGMKHTGSLMSSFLTVTISLPFYCVDSRRLYYICNWKLMKNEPLTHFFFFYQFIFLESKRLKSSKSKDNEWAILFITTQKKTLTIMSILILQLFSILLSYIICPMACFIIMNIAITVKSRKIRTSSSSLLSSTVFPYLVALSAEDTY